MLGNAFTTYLAIAQGAYFAITGLWPLLSIRTFMAVTGPKHDRWLVKTVGVLVLVIGVVLMLAGVRGGVSAEVIVLAIGGALGLGTVDVDYTLRGVIARIYLADAVIEAALVTLWLWAAFGTP